MLALRSLRHNRTRDIQFKYGGQTLPSPLRREEWLVDHVCCLSYGLLKTQFMISSFVSSLCSQAVSVQLSCRLDAQQYKKQKPAVAQHWSEDYKDLYCIRYTRPT